MGKPGRKSTLTNAEKRLHQKQASAEWRKAAREQIAIDVPKGDKARLAAVAKAEGLSLRGFVLDALDEKYSRIFPNGL